MEFAEAPHSLDPEMLSLSLRDAGWHRVGGRTGLYERLSRRAAGDDALDLLIPLDRNAPDFEELLNFAWSKLMSAPVEARFLDLLRLRTAGGHHDSLKFRKETAAPQGMISWPLGEQLIDAARLTLIAGAKAHLGARRYFGNAHGRFANRYLHEVLMGQTAVGSYVVTALTPVHTQIPLTNSKVEGFGVNDIDVAQGRQVTESVARAVESAVEAVQHFRSTGSMAGFDDGVSKGISHELVSALHALASDADEAGITVQWEPSTGGFDVGPTQTFELTGADAAPLDTASKRLAVMQDPVPGAFVRGRVDLLTKKQAGGPGVIGVESVTDGPRRVRVRLTPDDYHNAVRAHDEDRLVSFRGRLEREGNIYWLYDAEMLTPDDGGEDVEPPSRPLSSFDPGFYTLKPGDDWDWDS